MTTDTGIMTLRLTDPVDPTRWCALRFSHLPAVMHVDRFASFVALAAAKAPDYEVDPTTAIWTVERS